MPELSEKSNDLLDTCHQDLQDICREAIKYIDYTVINGHRNEQQQNEDFANHLSQKQWPDGKHNKLPSDAVDLAPFPIDWNNLPRFYLLAGIIIGIAAMKGIKIRWGGCWNAIDGNFDIKHNKFNDLGHFERVV